MKVVLKALRETIDLPTGQSFRIIRWDRNLREVESLQADGTKRGIEGEGLHWHRHVEMELTWLTSGSGTRFIGDHIGAFGPGEMVMLGSNLPHYWHADGDCAGISIQWHFPPAHAVWAFPEMERIAPGLLRAEKGLRLRGPAASKIGVLLEEMSANGGVARLARLMELLGVVGAAPKRDREVLSTRAFGSSDGSLHQEAIAKAVRYVIAGYRDEIRVEPLLKLTGMSRPTFSRQFKEHAGRTVSEFVNQLRLQAACRELMQTDRSVLEIALDCGFGQISFFNRVFRREKGCSPREYRNQRRA